MHDVQCTGAGVKLQPGSYQVQPDSALEAHILVTCLQTRTSAFEIDLSGSTLVYTARTATPLTLPSTLYAKLITKILSNSGSAGPVDS